LLTAATTLAQAVAREAQIEQRLTFSQGRPASKKALLRPGWNRSQAALTMSSSLHCKGSCTHVMRQEGAAQQTSAQV
jgi:hypothetical protein